MQNLSLHGRGPGLGLSRSSTFANSFMTPSPALDGLQPSLSMVRCFSLVHPATFAKSRSSIFDLHSSSTLAFERQCPAVERKAATLTANPMPNFRTSVAPCYAPTLRSIVSVCIRLTLSALTCASHSSQLFELSLFIRWRLACVCVAPHRSPSIHRVAARARADHP